MSNDECNICKNGVIWQCECIENIKAGKTFDGNDVESEMTEPYQCQACGEEYTESCSCVGAVYVRTADNIHAENVKLLADNAALRKVLELFMKQNRARGYPTGSEWIVIIKVIEQTLSKDETKGKL